MTRWIKEWQSIVMGLSNDDSIRKHIAHTKKDNSKRVIKMYVDIKLPQTEGYAFGCRFHHVRCHKITKFTTENTHWFKVPNPHAYNHISHEEPTLKPPKITIYLLLLLHSSPKQRYKKLILLLKCIFFDTLCVCVCVYV